MKKIFCFLIILSLLSFTGCSKEVQINEKIFDYGDNSTVYMPIVTLNNEKLSKQINDKIENILKENYIKVKGNKQGSTMEGFSAFHSGDLLSIFHEGYFEESSGTYGKSYLKTLHINVKNGNFYSFDDLFKKDVDYIGELTEIVNLKLETQLKESYIAYHLDIKNTSFDVFDNNLIFIFNPEMVSSVDMGFVDVVIPFSSIDHLLDKESEFYKVAIESFKQK